MCLIIWFNCLTHIDRQCTSLYYQIFLIMTYSVYIIILSDSVNHYHCLPYKGGHLSTKYTIWRMIEQADNDGWVLSTHFHCQVLFTTHPRDTLSYPAPSWRTGATSVGVRTLRTTNTPHPPRTATQTPSTHQHRNAQHTALMYPFGAFTTFWFVVCFKLKPWLFFH